MIQNRLKDLEKKTNGNNDRLSPPPSSPPSTFLPPPLPPSSLPPALNNFQPPSQNQNFKTQNQFLNAQSPLLLPPSKSSLFSSPTAVAVKPLKKIIDEIDTAIHEIPDPQKLELGKSLLSNLGTEAVDILKDDFVRNKSLEEKKSIR